MMQFKEPEIVMVDGRRLAYEEVSPPSPKGTIILLVGLGAKRQGWYKQLPAFGRYYRTLALDYRDVGDSDEAKESYTIKDLAEDTIAVMRALEIQHAHIIGISMGGFIALELALNYPQMLDKLVLVVTSAGGRGHVSPAREIMAVMIQPPEVEIGEAARKVCAAVSAPGFEENHPEEFDIFAEIARYRPMTEAAYFRQLAACRTHDVSQRFHQIQAPPRLIHGAVDPLVPLKTALHLARTIPRPPFIADPHTPHTPDAAPA